MCVGLLVEVGEGPYGFLAACDGWLNELAPLAHAFNHGEQFDVGVGESILTPALGSHSLCVSCGRF
jgi:hypothetical protein